MTLARAFVVRFLVLAVIWWAISEGDPSMLGYGVIAALGATATSIALLQPKPRSGPSAMRRLPAFARLIVWFLRQSILGGIDVVRRVARRTVDVDPDVVDVALTVGNPLARVVIADISCLTPGSLAVDITDDGLLVHVLDRSIDIDTQIGELETLIAKAFPDHTTPSPRLDLP